MNKEYSNFEEDVLPVDVEDKAIPSPLNKILPWHRPRKQFIRINQWELYTKRLIDKLLESQLATGSTMNYLSLPGIDYFDVEIVAQATRSRGLKLSSIGFLAESEGSPYHARSQVRLDTLVKKGLVEDTSTTFPYRFEELASKTSSTYREIKRRTPFHIVNIDACGSIARPSAQNSSKILDGIYRLIELQLSSIRDRWLLFLTTDARPNNLSTQVINAFLEAIKQNARESQEFKSEAVNYLNLDHSNIDAGLEAASSDPDKFISFFTLGFSKWLLHNAQDVDWDVKCLSQYCYSTTSQGNNDASMACLAFEFIPRPVHLTNRHNALTVSDPEIMSGVDYSMKALERARDLQNIDLLLNESTDMAEQYARGQLKLLENSGYQQATVEEYREKYITQTD